MPPLSFLNGFRDTLLQRHPLLVYVTTWTALVTATVALASFAPELAFTWALSPPSPFSDACKTTVGSVRLPLDGPAGEVVCMPALLFQGSKTDLVVPPLFAAVVVAASVGFVRAVGLWEEEDDDEEMQS